MSIQLNGNADSSFSDDLVVTGNVTAANLPAQGSIVGYQQGVWTPELTSSDGNGDYTHSSQVGFWWRIGNTIHVDFYVAISAKLVSGGGVQCVTGVPYGLIAASGGLEFHGSVSTADNWSTSYVPSALRMTAYPIGTTIQCRTNNVDNQYTTVGPGRSTATSTLGGSITYLTDDTTWTPINGATVS